MKSVVIPNLLFHKTKLFESRWYLAYTSLQHSNKITYVQIIVLLGVWVQILIPQSGKIKISQNFKDMNWKFAS